MYIVCNGVIWAHKEQRGLTAFAAIPDSDRAELWEKLINTAAYRLNWQKGATKEDIKCFEQQDLFGCSTYEELVMMHDTFVVLIKILFGAESFLYRELRKMQTHMKEYRESYKEPNLKTNKFWFVKILYRIDRTVQNFLHDCGHAKHFRKIRFETLSRTLETIRDTVEDNTLNVVLPTRFMQKDGEGKVLYKDDLHQPAREPERERQGNQQRYQENRAPPRQYDRAPPRQHDRNTRPNEYRNEYRPNDNVVAAVNPNVNPKWVTPRQFRVAQYLARGDENNPVPKNRGKQFCVMYTTR